MYISLTRIFIIYIVYNTLSSKNSEHMKLQILLVDPESHKRTPTCVPDSK
jgi:hypothetical protein